MIKKLILLVSIITIVTVACNKENAPIPDNAIEIESNESPINLRGGKFGPTIAPICDPHFDLGDCKGVWNENEYPILEIETDNNGTGFYNLQIGTTTSFDLRFNSNVYIDNDVVGVYMKVDGDDHPISIESAGTPSFNSPSPHVVLEFASSQPKSIQLIILSTDDYFLYEREIAFTLTLNGSCLKIDFGDDFEEVCGDGSGTIYIAIEQ